MSAWPVALGIVVGVLLFLPWSAGKAGRGVFKDALVALRALTLPILLVAVFGALRGPSPAIQFVVGVTAAGIVVPWLRTGEWRTRLERSARLRWIPHLPDGSVHQRATHASLLAVFIFGPLLVVVSLALLIPVESFDSFGGLPTALAFTASMMWAAAAILRLLGFALTPLRFVVSLMVLALTARGLLALGLFGLEWDARSWPTPAFMLVLAVLAFGVCVLLEGFSAQMGSLPGVPWMTQRWRPTLWPRLASWGLGLALASTVFIGLSLGVGKRQVEEGSSLSDRGLHAATRDELPRLARYGDRQLALAFLPVLRFHRDALWTPQSVDGYLREADLVRPDAPQIPLATTPDLSELPDHCENPWTDPCYVLKLGCSSAGPPEDRCPPTQPHGSREKPYQEGAAYVRVVRKPKPPEKEPFPFQDVGPPDVRANLSTLVQYWFFYDYDEWEAPVLGGRIVQRHEGDWEAVTVGLSETAPLFVAFSEHCGGAWQRWRKDVRVFDTSHPLFAADIDVTVGPRHVSGSVGPGDWNTGRMHFTHPAVAVAVGSQANYPPKVSGKAPDWSSCRGFPGESVELLSYVWNIRDRTGFDYAWLPSELHLVDAHVPPMSFPGTWGEKDTIQYVTVRDDTDRAGSRGPRTPSRQDLWRTPVREIFCSKGWRRPSGERKYSCKK